MKIDIEGFDHFALKGGQKFFKTYKIPYIMAEFEEIFFERLDYTMESHIQLWRDLGYDIRATGFEGPLMETIDDFRENLKIVKTIYLTLR